MRGRGTRPRAAELLDVAHRRVRGQPDLRRAGQPRGLRPQARRARTPTSPRRWSASSSGVAVYFHDLAERHREGVASGRTPADFAVRQTVAQLDALAGHADRRGPDARRAGPARRASTRPGGTSGCWPSCRSRCGPAVERYRDVLRDEVRPARPARRAVRADAPARRRRGLRQAARASTPRSTRSPQEIHEIGLRAGGRRSRRSTARSGPRWSAPTTSRRSSRRCATTRRCTTPAATRSSPTPRPRWPRPGRRWATGSAGCRSPTATSRRPPAARSPTTSRRPRTARRGGVFFMNVSDPEGWGRYEIENTSYHEGIPGHHLQLGDRRRARRRPGVPQARVHRGVRRGLGALHRAARRRDGAVLLAAGPDRDAVGGLDARVPAGRRHRHARARLEPAAGRRLHGRELADAGRPRRRRDRPLRRDARARRCPT